MFIGLTILAGDTEFYDVFDFPDHFEKCLLMQALQVCFAHFAKNEAQELQLVG